MPTTCRCRVAQGRIDDDDPRKQARAFEPFFTTKPPGVGTGLGLSVVFGIVTGMGGRIDIDTGPGKGTAVVMRLPIRE